MAVSLTPVLIANDTFLQWVADTNAIINAIATIVVTAGPNATGSSTTGNAILNGIFASNTFAVVDAIRGGNLTVAAPLVLGSNLDFQGFQISGNASATMNIGSTAGLNSSMLSVPSINATFLKSNATHIIVGGKSYSNLDPAISVSNNGVEINAAVAKLNFQAAGAIEIDVSSNATHLTVGIGANAAALGVANTSNTQILFNNSGTIGGSANFVFYQNLGQLDVDIIDVYSSKLYNLSIAEDVSEETSVVASLPNTDVIVVDSFLKADWMGAEYIITNFDAAANGRIIQKILVVHDVDNAYMTLYGQVSTNTSFTASYNVAQNSSHIYLTAQTSSSNSRLRGKRTLLTSL